MNETDGYDDMVLSIIIHYPESDNPKTRLHGARMLTTRCLLNPTNHSSFCLIDTKDFNERPCPTKHYIINANVCYKFVPLERPKMSKRDNNYDGDELPLFLVGTSFLTSSLRFKVMLNQIERLPRYEYVSAKMIPEDERVAISAYSFKISRQPAPYADDCLVYEPRYEDMDDAIAGCVNEIIKNETGRLGFMKTFDRTSNDLNFLLQEYDRSGKLLPGGIELQRNSLINCKKLIKT